MPYDEQGNFIPDYNAGFSNPVIEDILTHKSDVNPVFSPKPAQKENAVAEKVKKLSASPDFAELPESQKQDIAKKTYEAQNKGAGGFQVTPDTTKIDKYIADKVAGIGDVEQKKYAEKEAAKQYFDEQKAELARHNQETNQKLNQVYAQKGQQDSVAKAHQDAIADSLYTDIAKKQLEQDYGGGNFSDALLQQTKDDLKQEAKKGQDAEFNAEVPDDWFMTNIGDAKHAISEFQKEATYKAGSAAASGSDEHLAGAFEGALNAKNIREKKDELLKSGLSQPEMQSQLSAYIDEVNAENPKAKKANVASQFIVDGKPTLEFKKQVYDIAQGDPSRFKDVATDLINFEHAKWSNTPTQAQIKSQEFQDYLAQNNAPAYWLHRYGQGLVNKTANLLGETGKGIIDALGGDSYAESLQHSKEIQDLIDPATNHPADESKMGTINKVISHTAEGVGDLQGQFYTLGKVPIPGLNTGKSVKALTSFLEQAPVKTVQAYADNLLSTTKMFGLSTFNGYVEKAKSMGYTDEEAMSYARKHTATSLPLMAFAQQAITGAVGQGNVANKILNPKVNTLKGAVKAGAEVAPVMVANSLSDKMQDFYDAKKRGEIDEDAQFDFGKAVNESMHEGVPGFLIGAVMHTINNHGTPPSDIQSQAISNAINDRATFNKQMSQAIEKGEMTREQAATVQRFLDKVEPEYAAASKESKKGGTAIKLSVEKLRRDEVATKLAEETAKPEEQQRPEVISDLQEKLNSSDKTLKQLQAGTYIKGRTVSGEEMKSIAEANGATPKQATEIRDNGPYQSETIDITQFANDPEIKATMAVMEHPDMGKSYQEEIQPLLDEREAINLRHKVNKTDRATDEKLKEVEAKIKEVRDRYPVFHENKDAIGFQNTNEAPPILGETSGETAEIRRTEIKDKIAKEQEGVTDEAERKAIEDKYKNELEALDRRQTIIDGKKRVAQALLDGKTEMEVAVPVPEETIKQQVQESDIAAPFIDGLQEPYVGMVSKAREAFDRHVMAHDGYKAAAEFLSGQDIKHQTKAKLLRAMTGNEIPYATAQKYINDAKKGVKAPEIVEPVITPEQDANTIASAEGVDVGEQASNGSEMGEGNATGETATESTGKEQAGEVQKVTSTKNEVVDAEREARNMPPAEQAARRDFGTVWDEAAKIVEDKPSAAIDLINSLNKKSRSVTDVENALILRRQIELQNQYEQATKDIVEANEAGDEAAIAKNRLDLARISDDLLDVYNVGKSVGTETGRGLNARKMLANQDFTLSSMITQKRAANDGAKLTPEVQKQIEELSAKLDAKQKEFDEYVAKAETERQERESVTAGEETVEQLKRTVRREKRASTRGELKEERKSILESIKQKKAEFKKNNMVLSSPGIPLLNAAIIPDVVRLAKNYVQDGYIKLADVVDAVHSDLVDHFEGLTKREVRDAISGYGKTSQPNKDEVEAQLREIKAQGRLVSALEDAEKGQPPLRTGHQREAPSQEVRNLQKKVREAMKENGIEVVDAEKQLKTSLDGVKTRLRNQIEDIVNQINTGEKQAQKTGVEYDEAAKSLREERDALKEVLESVEGKSEMTDEQRVRLATAAVERSIADYERRIKEKDFDPKERKTAPETQELKDARQRRDFLKEQLAELKEAEHPSKTPEQKALEQLKKRLEKRKSELEERIANEDYAPKAKKEPIKPDAEAMKLQAEVERLKRQFKDGLEKDRLKNRHPFEKFVDAMINYRTSVNLLSGVFTLGKLGSYTAAQVGKEALDIVNSAITKVVLPGIYKKAATEGSILGGKGNFFKSFFQKDTYKQAYSLFNKDNSDIDVLFGDHMKPERMKFSGGKLHAVEKYPLKKATFEKYYKLYSEHFQKEGLDMSQSFNQKMVGGLALEQANRAILQNKNVISGGFQSALRYLENSGTVPGKIGYYTLKTLFPIMSVPTNFAIKLGRSQVGALEAITRIAYYGRNMTPQQADSVLRAFKAGMPGIALGLMAIFSDAFETDEHGKLKIGGWEMPKWMTHHPDIFIMKLYADAKRDAKKNGASSVPSSLALGTLHELPFMNEITLGALDNTKKLNTYGLNLAKSFVLPQAVKDVAKLTDGDQQKKPRDFVEKLMVDIPVLRSQVPDAKKHR